MKVDYHIHTNYSDGIYSIPEILSLIRKNDIHYFSITDHDNIESVTKLTQLQLDFSTYISGVEITCAEYTLDNISSPFSIHILGYDFDPLNPELISVLETRKQRVENTFHNLLNEISLIIQKNILLADIPISCGVVLQLCDIQNYITEIFPIYSDKVCPLINDYAFHLSNSNISIKEAIDAIHSAGGKAVWAHPYHVYNHFKKKTITLSEVEYILIELMNLDIDGIEANYLDFLPKQRDTLKALAIRNHLLYTSGSDYHGSLGRNCIGIEISSYDIPFIR